MRIEELPCVCISLVRRPDRWKRFMDQPEVSKLPLLKRLDAVDGKTINVRADKRINPFTKKNILLKQRRSHEELDSVGGIGCALSHIAAWKQAQEHDYFLIFEDDAVVPPGFVETINTALASMPPFDLLVLSRVKTFRGTPPQGSAFAPIDAFALAHAYIISRRAAKILFDEALPISHHIDFYMSVQAKIHNLKVVASPTIFLKQAGQTSDIQTKPICHMCDIPTDFYKHSLLIPYGRWTIAKSSEYALIAVLLGYIVYRTLGGVKVK